MEQQGSLKQASLQFRCKKIAPSKIKEAEVVHDSKISIESPTPVKLESRSIIKGRQLFEDSDDEGVPTRSEETIEKSSSVVVNSADDDSIELPEECQELCALFERMICSIRLLSLRKKLATFRNISTQVEILCKRKFLSSHLAQMKYAYPEAIQVEKILIHDQSTLCMIPDMKVTLVQDAVGCHLDFGQSVSTALCEAFRGRLLDFIKHHPEGADIPQDVLPEPFNPGNHFIPKMGSIGSLKESSQGTSLDNVLSGASHFSSSFHQQFSHKIIPEREQMEIPASPAPLVSALTDEDSKCKNSPQMEAIQCSASSIKSHAGASSSHVTPEKSEFTAEKDYSIQNDLMTLTPSLQTPKRPVPTTQEKHASEEDTLLTEPKSANSVRRSLIFVPSEVDESPSDLDACASAQDEVSLCAYGKTTAKRNIFLKETIGSITNQMIAVSNSAASVSEGRNMSPSGEAKSHNPPGCLLGMFDTICLILRSTDCSFITKQELVHKIILNDLEIEETSEVEEQLQMLEQLVPDWISKKAASDGNCFYCIKQAYDRESLRARLVDVA